MSEERFGRYYKEYEMEDGEKVRMILTSKHLLMLKTIDERAYADICKIVFNGLNEDYEKITKVLYGAYVCANMKEFMTYEDFLDGMNPNVVRNANLAADLITASKN